MINEWIDGIIGKTIKNVTKIDNSNNYNL